MAQDYSEKYREEIFYIWYNSGKKISQSFVNSLPEDEKGQSPSLATLTKWKDSYGWVERAEGLDTQIAQRFEEDAINKRVKMYEEHVEVSTKLLELAKNFIEEHPIEEMGDALKAINLAIEIQRTSIGQAEMGQRVLKMSNEQLDNALNKLIGKTRQNDEFIIDADTEDND